MDASESLQPAVSPTPSNKRGWIILAVDIVLLILLLKYCLLMTRQMQALQ